MCLVIDQSTATNPDLSNCHFPGIQRFAIRQSELYESRPKSIFRIQYQNQLCHWTANWKNPIVKGEWVLKNFGLFSKIYNLVAYVIFKNKYKVESVKLHGLEIKKKERKKLDLYCLNTENSNRLFITSRANQF